ncbi:MAG: protein O-GlcNAc transferase [Chthoniobacter sp.]|jgi:predicted O-linked N-acetylglucosamine transferase (SPINDLY family)|nr:protein O-GlcNAc transferase [Chthoniobacter sp.]
MHADSGSFQEALDAAVALHRRGALAEAIARYERLLIDEPRHAAVLANLASALKRAGRDGEALECLRRALEADATRPEVWFNQGNLLHQTGRLPEAEASFRRALALDPAMVPAQVNLANLLRDQRCFEEAERLYREALRLQPDLAVAATNLARLLAHTGRADEAIELHRRILRLAPQSAASLRGLALLLYQRRELEEAARLYQQAIEAEPRHADTFNSLGVVLKELGRSAEAVGCWEQALALDPALAAAHNNLGAMFRLRRQPQGAIAHLREAVRLAPDDAMAGANLAHALLDLGQVAEAEALARGIIAAHPESADGPLMLGFALTQQARIEEAFAAFMEAHRLKPEAPAPLSNALFASLYSDQRDAAQHLATHRELAARLAPGRADPPVRPAPPPDQSLRVRPLRVGYLSPDFRSHPVAYFFEPVLANHDRANVVPICYATNEAKDEVTARLRRDAAEWRDCEGWDDDRLAAQIAADRIDILVDLAGHTAGNRAGVLRRKPAPVQALYLGYPCTSGLPEIDWLIADAHICPPGHERFYSERIARLPGSFWCYQPRSFAPECGPLPARANGFVTFGSFNTLPKLSPTTVRLWARILGAVPGSRLVVKALALADAFTRELLRRRFVAAGIHPDRLAIEPPTIGLQDFLGEYRRIDIALDPVPYVGGTTTCEALWMGVPVVTLAGAHFFSRMALSFLHNVGHAALAADSSDEYVRIAAGLAAGPPRLESLRQSLRPTMAASPICDAPRAARELEEAFRKMAFDRS